MNTRRDLAALALFGLAFALAVWAYPRLPEVLPVHWGPDGRPDRFGSRFEALFLLPGILGASALLMTAVERTTPNGASNAPLLGLTRLGLGLLAALLTAAQVFDWPMARVVLLGVGALFALLGNSLGQARPSPFVGVRTPWTFASRRAWFASQRRGAVWLTAHGLVLLLLGLFVPDRLLFPWVAPIGLGGGTVLMTAWLVLASYLDWRRDPAPERMF